MLINAKDIQETRNEREKYKATGLLDKEIGIFSQEVRFTSVHDSESSWRVSLRNQDPTRSLTTS